MSNYPKRADAFREWSKLMLDQAIVPERVQYKSSGPGATRGRPSPTVGARRRRKRRKNRYRNGLKRRKRQD